MSCHRVFKAKECKERQTVSSLFLTCPPIAQKSLFWTLYRFLSQEDLEKYIIYVPMQNVKVLKH
jgi:hypothetical protein